MLNEGVTTTVKLIKTMRELKKVVGSIHHEHLMGDKSLRKVSGVALRSTVEAIEKEEEELSRMKREMNRLDSRLKDEHEAELRRINRGEIDRGS